MGKLLDRTVLLQWLRANTDLYDKGKEEEFEEILSEFIENLKEDNKL